MLFIIIAGVCGIDLYMCTHVLMMFMCEHVCHPACMEVRGQL